MSKDFNVILISLDAVRADHLGCYGYSRNTSPNIDALAKKGVLFDQAIAASCWTLPSHATMLSGLHPAVHGADSKIHKIKKNVKLLSQILKEHGYRTAGLVSIDFVSEFYGFDRGFDFFKNFAGTIGEKAARKANNAEQMFSQAIEWVEKNMEKKFFLFMHVIDTHGPYIPIEEFNALVSESLLFNHDQWNRFKREALKVSKALVEQMIKVYDAKLNFVDAQIGLLVEKLKALNLLKKTILIITSDHGEQFWEHDYLGHDSFWEEELRIPLLIYCPKLFKPAKVKQLVRHADITPTVIDVLGFENNSLEFEGVGLKPAIEGKELGLKAIPEAGLREHNCCIRTDKWKYFERTILFIAKISPFSLSGLKSFIEDCLALLNRFKKRGVGFKYVGLFDLENDPEEKYNVVKRYPWVAAKLKQEIIDYYTGLGERLKEKKEKIAEGTPEAEEVKKRLQALGYID